MGAPGRGRFLRTWSVLRGRSERGAGRRGFRRGRIWLEVLPGFYGLLALWGRGRAARSTLTRVAALLDLFRVVRDRTTRGSLLSPGRRWRLVWSRARLFRRCR